MSMTSAELATVTGGKLLAGSPAGPRSFVVCAIDHRILDGQPALFGAFAGAAADGHDFVELAATKGATVALIACDETEALAHLSGVIDLVAVPDVAAAISAAAVVLRSRYSGQVTAVTGSAGKTTTKEMVAHVLAACGCSVTATRGNMNNLLGMPVTLISAARQDEHLVLELGSNAPGEIPTLAAMAKPDAAVITAVLPAHLEGFRDLDGVLREKASLGLAVHRDGAVFIPSHDTRLMSVRHSFQARVFTFGYAETDDVCIEAAAECRLGVEGVLKVDGSRFPVRLPMPGRFNLVNAAAAMAVARFHGRPPHQVAEALQTFKGHPMRMELRVLDGVAYILDAYNANPGSMVAAIEALAGRPVKGRRVAVLGAMYELGEDSARLHADVARMARTLGLTLVLVGPDAAAYLTGDPMAHHVETPEQAADWLLHNTRPGDSVLLKGSRRARVESVLAAFMNRSR